MPSDNCSVAINLSPRPAQTTVETFPARVVLLFIATVRLAAPCAFSAEPEAGIVKSIVKSAAMSLKIPLPDGSRLLACRKDKDDVYQIYVEDRDGGDAIGLSFFDSA